MRNGSSLSYHKLCLWSNTMSFLVSHCLVGTNCEIKGLAPPPDLYQMPQKSVSLTDLFMQLEAECTPGTLSLYCPRNQYDNAKQ